MQKGDIKNLKRRYLIWLYKTTKEAFDKIERKFTQLDIDRAMFRSIKKDISHYKGAEKDKLKKLLQDFNEYINKKEKDGRLFKLSDRRLSSDYQFLAFKLKAIEKAIIKKLGKRELSKIKSLYEKEMTERILKSKEH